jgi:hypothetical protein
MVGLDLVLENFGVTSVEIFSAHDVQRTYCVKETTKKPIRINTTVRSLPVAEGQALQELYQKHLLQILSKKVRKSRES